MLCTCHFLLYMRDEHTSCIAWQQVVKAQLTQHNSKWLKFSMHSMPASGCSSACQQVVMAQHAQHDSKRSKLSMHRSSHEQHDSHQDTPSSPEKVEGSCRGDQSTLSFSVSHRQIKSQAGQP